MYNIQPCVEMGTLQHNPMWRSVLASDYTDRSLYLTVIVCRSRHIFALFLHCFHYPGVSVKNGCTIWYSVSLPCNVWRKPSTILFLFGMLQSTLQQTSTGNRHNSLLLRSKDFNSCKNCFDVRLFARFSLKPHKHIYVDIFIGMAQWWHVKTCMFFFLWCSKSLMLPAFSSQPILTPCLAYYFWVCQRKFHSESSFSWKSAT